MLGLGTLDVAIGLVFVYLMLSLGQRVILRRESHECRNSGKYTGR